MFATMQRMRTRPTPTGRARIVRAAIIAVIFGGAFYAFEAMQVGRLGASLDYQYTQIAAVNDNMTPQMHTLLASMEKKFGGSGKFFSDPAFTAEPLAGRIERSIDEQERQARGEAAQAEQQVVLYDLVKWAIPGAVAKEDAHTRRLNDLFHGANYTDYATSQQRVQDFNAAIQHCQGTPLKATADGGGAGYVESKSLAAAELDNRAGLVNAAADRTLCASVPKLSK